MKTPVPDTVADLSAQLKRRGAGAALDTSTLARALYSSDASLSRVVPRVVAHPRDLDELLAVVDAARAVGMPVTTRGPARPAPGTRSAPG
jgi:FAD/FMN-containing dehydrogenase